jgi:photosystem II stability/assembly factor-like uncharacterized protein
MAAGRPRLLMRGEPGKGGRLKQIKTLAVLVAVLLIAGGTGCADKEFVQTHGSPPASTAGLNAWIVSGRSLWHTANGGADWTRQLERAPRHLNGVAFADARHGWAVGAQGLILATSDGGETWTTQRRVDAALWYVTCTDADHAWAVGPQGTLVSTSDGGVSWHAGRVSGVEMGSSNGGGIGFADAERGWIASGDAIRTTADGGRTWTLQYRHKGSRLSGLACADADHLWVVGARGADDLPLILATSDGGASWKTQHVGKRGADLVGFWLTAVACADAEHAWAGGSRGGSVLVTSDGGRTWRVERLPASLNAYSIAAADTDRVFLTTNGQPVLVSGDGGLTWSASGSTAWLEGPAQGVAAISTAAQ